MLAIRYLEELDAGVSRGNAALVLRASGLPRVLQCLQLLVGRNEEALARLQRLLDVVVAVVPGEGLV